jgi:hypothetical protein
MWQVPNQKLRAMISARKREKERAKQAFHIRRTHAQLKIVSPPTPNNQILDVRVVLNDISPKQMCLFSSTPLAPGQIAAVTIDEPRRIYVRARILGCQELDCESKVISTQAFGYRLTLAFIFESEEEERQFKSFYEELATEVLGTVRAA